MKLFDSHCHLNDRKYNKDSHAVIKRAEEAGIKRFMIPGYSRISSEIAVKIADKHPGCYAAVGIHPHSVKDIDDDLLNYLIKLTENKKVTAWGEIGLDFNRMFSPQDLQEKWFLKQMETADNLGLPIIFHERDSKGRFLELLKKHHNNDRKGVVHCFGGTKDELSEYIELGCYIGVTGIVTLKGRGDSLQELIKYIPIDKLVIETDCPYLTPYPDKLKNNRNEPAFVKSVFHKITEILNEDNETLSTILWNNTCELYGIDY